MRPQSTAPATGFGKGLHLSLVAARVAGDYVPSPRGSASASSVFGAAIQRQPSMRIAVACAREGGIDADSPFFQFGSDSRLGSGSPPRRAGGGRSLRVPCRGDNSRSCSGGFRHHVATKLGHRYFLFVVFGFGLGYSSSQSNPAVLRTSRTLGSVRRAIDFRRACSDRRPVHGGLSRRQRSAAIRSSSGRSGWYERRTASPQGRSSRSWLRFDRSLALGDDGADGRCSRTTKRPCRATRSRRRHRSVDRRRRARP